MTLRADALRLGERSASDPAGLSFTLPPRARWVILGENGSGKSTLAQALAGLLPAYRECVSWAGRPWAAYSHAERAERVQFVGQRPDLQLSGRTESLFREVAFGPENLGRPPREIREATAQSLQDMGLASLAQRHPRRLSGGESQRLAIASALAMEPALLVLDEPVTDLDATARAEFPAVLDQLSPDLSVICFDVEIRPWMRGFFHRYFRLETGQLVPFVPEPLVQDALSLPAEPPFAPADPAIVLQAVGFRHQDAPPLLRGFSLCCPPGSVTALAGPNGVGKTTVLRLISGLAQPLAGTIRVAGLDPAVAAAQALARVLGSVFQNADRQILSSTVLAEVSWLSRRLGMPDWRDRALGVLDHLGLTALAAMHPLDLNTGVRRLVMAAAAVAHGPSVLLLDETQRGLDAGNIGRLEALIRSEQRRGTAIVLISHDTDFMARNATAVVRMDPSLQDARQHLEPRSAE